MNGIPGIWKPEIPTFREDVPALGLSEREISKDLIITGKAGLTDHDWNLKDGEPTALTFLLTFVLVLLRSHLLHDVGLRDAFPPLLN